MPKIFPNNIVKNTLELLHQHKSPRKFWTELLSRIRRQISCVPNLILPLVYLNEVQILCDAHISTWVRKGERGDMSRVRTIKGAAVKMQRFPIHPCIPAACIQNCCADWDQLNVLVTGYCYIFLQSYTSTNTASYTTQCHTMCPVMLIMWDDSNVMLYVRYCNQCDPPNAGN